MAGAILGAAIVKLAGGGAETIPAVSAAELDLWRRMALWPFTLNALVGLDLGAAMSDEADAPARNIPSSLLIGGIAVGLCYVLTYSALLLIGFGETNVIYGHLLAVNSVLAQPGLAITAAVGALIVIIELLGLIGSGAAWLAAPARVPFVIGIDRYLPESFSRVHPRYGTPYVALLIQAIVATLLILVNIYGATLQEAYLALLGGSIVLVMVTYLYLFGAWQRLSRLYEGRNLRVFKSSADREAALLQQILSPGLRSRNAERRQEATEALEDLAAVTTHLKHLLLVGDLHSLVS